jgi:Fe-S cluster biogenesis protein NfuA
MSGFSQNAVPPSSDGGEIQQRVRKVLELIRPAIQSDGGDIEFVGVTDAGTVQIRLHGACVGCPSSAITLKFGIERNLRAYVPEIRAVEAVV